MLFILDGNSEVDVYVYVFKAFDYNEVSHKSDDFSPKRHNFLHACVTCSELPNHEHINYIN